MAPRKRKQAQKQSSKDDNKDNKPNGNGISNANGQKSHSEASSNHVGDPDGIKDALTKLSSNLPRDVKIEVRHPSLSRSPSVADYLHNALFVSEAEAKERKKYVPAGTRRRVILLLGIVIGMVLATVLMKQSKDAAYIEAFSHYFHDFDLASMVPTGMIPDEFIGNVSAMFKPEILTEEEF